MASNLLLIAALPLASASSCRTVPAPSALTARDAGELAALWMRCYPPSITTGETLASATVDMDASFRGEYGTILSGATLGIRNRGELIAAVLTVERAPWSDAPDCPFVIELFVAPERRGQGWARALLQAASGAAEIAGADRIALRVEADNAPARELYARVGFTAT